LAVGIKLNLMLQGQPCNIDAASLWSKVLLLSLLSTLFCALMGCDVPPLQAQALNLHFSKWNEWVLARYEEAFDD
jgi:hypothetical protein